MHLPLPAAERFNTMDLLVKIIGAPGTAGFLLGGPEIGFPGRLSGPLLLTDLP